MGRFRIKIKPWIHSDAYAVIKYSTNGIFWKKIKSCERDIMVNWYNMEPLIIHYSNIEREIKRFDSLLSIKKYENEQMEQMNRYNSLILKQRKAEEEKKRAVYGKYS